MAAESAEDWETPITYWALAFTSEACSLYYRLNTQAWTIAWIIETEEPLRVTFGLDIGSRRQVATLETHRASATAKHCKSQEFWFNIDGGALDDRLQVSLQFEFKDGVPLSRTEPIKSCEAPLQRVNDQIDDLVASGEFIRKNIDTARAGEKDDRSEPYGLRLALVTEKRSVSKSLLETPTAKYLARMYHDHHSALFNVCSIVYSSRFRAC